MKVTVAFSTNDGQTEKEAKETIPLTVTSKKKIRKTLTSECKICVIKTSRPKKEIEEDIRRWKDLPC